MKLRYQITPNVPSRGNAIEYLASCIRDGNVRGWKLWEGMSSHARSVLITQLIAYRPALAVEHGKSIG